MIGRKKLRSDSEPERKGTKVSVYLGGCYFGAAVAIFILCLQYWYELPRSQDEVHGDRLTISEMEKVRP